VEKGDGRWKREKSTYLLDMSEYGSFDCVSGGAGDDKYGVESAILIK
jgi:hypothetical protein